MMLFIDTTVKDSKIIFSNNEDFVLTWESQDLTLELLNKIELLLAEHNYCKEDISAIAVNRGPGSYTGTRIGVSVANALSYSLKIPVYGYGPEDRISDIKKHFAKNPKPAGGFIRVKYKAPPKITISTK